MGRRRKFSPEVRERAGKRDGTTTDEQQRMKDLESEVKELRHANELLRKVSAYFAQAKLDRRLK